MKAVLFCLAALLAPSAWATTYTYAGPNYGTFTNFTSCTVGPCANYTASMSLHGSFTTASPLAANINTDITSLVTSYNFSDGVNTYSSANSNARIWTFQITTDGTGQITGALILVELWQTGSSPHAVGSRVALTAIGVGGTPNLSYNNLNCTSVGVSPDSGVSDTCNSTATDSSSSEGFNTVAGAWSIAASNVPALGEWGMICLAVLLVLCAWYSFRSLQNAGGKA